VLKRIMVLVLAIAMVAAACGDDDGNAGSLTDGEQAVAGVIAASMLEDQDPEDPFSDPEAARCFSEGAVRNLGVARLAEIGINAESDDPQAGFATMTESELNEMAELALGCVDIETAMADQFAVDGISQESGLCMARAFGETDFYKQAFIAGMTDDDSYDPGNDPEFLGLMLTIATDCLTADELSLIMGG